MLTAEAQIPNQSFENWINLPSYEEPETGPVTKGRSSSNQRVYLYQEGLGVRKVPGISGSAMHIETITPVSGENVTGYFIWGNEPDNDNMIFRGGFPFTDSAVKNLEVSLRYHIDSLNPGWVLLQFRKNGVAIGGQDNLTHLYAYPVKGSETEFRHFSFPVLPVLPAAPDTVVIAFASNDVFREDHNGVPGNFLDVENVSFDGNSGSVPNGSLENWVTVPTPEVPVGWDISPDYLMVEQNLKSSESKEGNYSLRLTTSWTGNYKITGRAYTGRMYTDSSGTHISRGFKLDKRPELFTVSYRYISLANDTGSANIYFTGLDKLTGKRIITGGLPLTFTSSPEWKKMSGKPEIWNNTVIPDSAYIEFSAGWPWNRKGGAELLIDQIMMESCPDKISISGSSAVCAGSDPYEYSVPYKEGTTYIWSAPEDASVIPGELSSNIRIEFGEGSGVVSVRQIFSDGCPEIESALNVAHVTEASAEAGLPDTICTDGFVLLKGAVTGGAGLMWESETGGYFSDYYALETTYYPSSYDYDNGFVKLRVTTTGNGVCSEGRDSVVISIVPRPFAYPGANTTICESQNSVKLNGFSDGTLNTWENLSGGTFSDKHSLTAEYKISKADSISGRVKLILYSSNSFCTVKDSMLVRIERIPVVAAGEDVHVCNESSVNLIGEAFNSNLYYWTASGTGAFESDSTEKAVTYQISQEDRNADSLIFIFSSYGQMACKPTSDSLTLFFEICTGLEDQNLPPLNIYPVPAENYIILNAGDKTPASIKVTSLNGETLMNIENPGNGQQIEVSNLKPGMYFIIAELEGRQVREKFVVK
jgi:hypothetical protein